MEALVGHLFKGDVVGGEDGGAPPAGTDGMNAGAEKLALFEGGGDGVGVQTRGRSRGRRAGSGFESFIFDGDGSCEAVGGG